MIGIRPNPMKNKKIPVFFSSVFFLALSSSVFAQSMAEYGLLTASVAAAAAAKKSKGQQGTQAEGTDATTGMMSKVYGDSADALNKGGALLGQVGEGFGTPSKEQAPEPTEEKKEEAAPPKEEVTPKEEAAPPKEENNLTKLYLKSGSVIEGTVVEKDDNHVKLESFGIAVTYFTEEIEKIVSGGDKDRQV
jgi:hypothetical protein